MSDLEFFDCNTWIGAPTNVGYLPPVTAESLEGALDKAGIGRAVVWHIAQHDHDALTGNQLLAEAIRSHDRFTGCWTILPTHTGEMGELSDWLEQAMAANVRVLRASPDAHRYPLDPLALADLLEACVERRLPLLLSFQRGATWERVYNLMQAFPELTVILADLHVWPTDRQFRPLLREYPRVYMETSMYLADGGIETFVRDCGPERMLYGSGFPQCYHGSGMLAIAHAEIGDADKRLIASGNLARLIEEVYV